MKKSLLTLFLVLSIAGSAQENYPAKIGLETLIGKRSALDVSASKQFAEKWRYRFGHSSISYWDNNKGALESVTNNNIDYLLTKNIALSAGIQYHFLKGLVPNFSISGNYANPTWFIMVSPSIGVAPHFYSGIVGNIEFKPLVGNNIRLFFNGKAMYNYDFTNDAHDRSYYYLRAGVMVKKFVLGAGYHLDFYAPQVFRNENYGAFVRINF